MRRNRILRVTRSLFVAGGVLSILVVRLLAGQGLPSTTTDGMELTTEQVEAVLNKVKDNLEGKGLPSGWVDELIKDPPDITFEADIGENQALYQPASQGPLGRSGNTIYLKPGLDLNNLSDDDLATITHESWHGWFDFVPTYVPLFGSSIGALSDAQDEAVGGFIDELSEGNTIPAAVTRAEAEALERGGTIQDAVNAIGITEEALDGSFFTNPLPTDADVGRWETLRRTSPEVQQLEQFFSEPDVLRIKQKAEERARLRDQPLPDDDPVGTAGGNAAAADPPSVPATTPSPRPVGPVKGAVFDPSFPFPDATPEPTPPAGVPIPYPNTGLIPDAGRGTNTVPAPTPNAADAAPAAEVADPDCDPCVPIAAKLRDALQRQQDLEQELEDVEARLDQLPDAIDDAERDQQALEDEYQRRLEDTRVSSGEREGRYYEVGGTVFITVGTMQGDTYVPDEIPDPNAPQDLGDASGPRRSPYMNRLRERIDEAASAAEDLRAEQTELTDRQTQLAADVAAAQAAVDQLRQELEDCLKTCGQPGSMNPQPTMTTGGTTPLGGGPRGPGGSIFVGNPTDFLSGVNLYALTTPDGVPYALAPPREDAEDRYQLFIAWFVRVGQSPAATPPDALDATPGDVRRQPPPAPWARLAHRMRNGMARAFGWLTPPLYAVAPAPRLVPGTRVWLGAAGQDRPSPAVSFVATGASSGDALTVELAETTGTAVEVVAPDGLVLQAVRSGRGTRVSQGGGPVTTAPVTGFCLEYEKPPPPADTLYQVAPASVQERYQAMRPILEAGRTLAEAGLLNPDSDLASYATFIQQWSVWTQLEDWDQGEFTRAFIDRTRKNVENAGQRFTDQMRTALEGAAPNRFTDILKVLVEAEGLVGRPPFSLAQF